jgi:iron complex transport system ATP-binding protein
MSKVSRIEELDRVGKVSTKRKNVLEIRSLCVSYGDLLALNDVCLDVREGEILVVIGPNGAGKSTLIRAVSGVLPYQKGSVRINGEDLSRMNPVQRARRLAVVPQARNLPPAFTVYQSVMMGRTPYLGWLGRAGPRDFNRVRAALENTQTSSMSDRRVGELSGGEQQRVLLARALSQDTPVLLLDEPTTHLDLKYQSELLNLIWELVSEGKEQWRGNEHLEGKKSLFSDRRKKPVLSTGRYLSVLMVLHDLNLASLYADRVALLVEGRLETLGTPEEVLTERNLSAVYNIPVHVMPHPVYNRPLVLPDGRIDGHVSEGERS